ncbi:phosphate acyltransferase [Rhodoplanes roseus]|uniref:Phosphate butyryltransferase n=1 Tax=Rhodoplanes roseus TaxID=29409 RepID=A0A327L203_9BRAD|nr:phosphate acyltransferase [Rhodoplanes roseus]RAI45110.1 phosphate butyryltransferase [Rhodoplanes roseus]
MIYSSFDNLVDKVRDGAARRKVVAVVAAEDGHTLEAVAQATRDGILIARLIGRADKIRAELAALGEDAGQFEIVDAEDPIAAAKRAAELVRDGAADFVMKGKVQTADLLRAMLSSETGMRTGRQLSHFALVQIPNYHKLIGLTDVAINIAPDLAQKKEIVENAVFTMRAIGFDPPNVALLSSAETINPKMPETAEAAELTRLNREGWLAGSHLEGPISYDLAISRESARIKGYDSPLPGEVDLLVVPHITVGNTLLKALRYSAGAASAGIVVGGRVPIVLTSRAVEAQDKFLPLVIAASVSGD